jgi:hypothetical protein
VSNTAASADQASINTDSDASLRLSTMVGKMPSSSSRGFS